MSNVLHFNVIWNCLMCCLNDCSVLLMLLLEIVAKPILMCFKTLLASLENETGDHPMQLPVPPLGDHIASVCKCWRSYFIEGRGKLTRQKSNKQSIGINTIRDLYGICINWFHLSLICCTPGRMHSCYLSYSHLHPQPQPSGRYVPNANHLPSSTV